MNDCLLKIKKYKQELFGKDVLSIIDAYDPEGFDKWFIIIKSVNIEYHSLFHFDNNHNTLNHHGFETLFNYRKLGQMSNIYRHYFLPNGFLEIEDTFFISHF